MSVVVCTRRRPAALDRCLSSLAALEPDPLEVIVVDSWGGDHETQSIADRHCTRYLPLPAAGISRARNAGAMAARGTVVAFIDDDAEADAGWLAAHAEAHTDPRVAASSGRILPGGSTGIPGATGHEGDLGTHPFWIDSSSPHWFGRTNFGGAGTGVNLAIRRSLFASGWGFHERLGLGSPIPGGEEHYAFFDLVRRGHRVAYTPAAVVRHDSWSTAGDDRARSRRIAAGAVAYMVMLLVEEPAHRRHLLRYLLHERGQSQEWRAARRSEKHTGSRSDYARALLLGPMLYVRARSGGPALTESRAGERPDSAPSAPM